MMNNPSFMKIFRQYLKCMCSINQKNREAFADNYDKVEVSKAALKSSKEIRGPHRPPAIIIHGVMPRSGTVYTGELLRLHPDIYAYPNELWEIPFLELSGELKNIQQLFFKRYKLNRERMGELDLLPLFGASLISYLYSFVPADKTLLIKVPDVQFLSYFPIVFPHENLLLLMRDGRDLVSSTIKTWPEEKFSKVCLQWKNSAQHMINFNHYQSLKRDNYQMFKYEDILDEPAYFARNACQRYGLDINSYPYDEIGKLPYRGSSTLQTDGGVSWEPINSCQSAKTVGHWQQWPAKHTKQFKKIAGEVLIQAGYCKDQNW
jgi:protein-tyrosine sulfotransferase